MRGGRCGVAGDSYKVCCHLDLLLMHTFPATRPHVQSENHILCIHTFTNVRPHLSCRSWTITSPAAHPHFYTCPSTLLLPQLDNHIPCLSVLETLEFAQLCQVWESVNLDKKTSAPELAFGRGRSTLCCALSPHLPVSPFSLLLLYPHPRWACTWTTLTLSVQLRKPSGKRRRPKRQLPQQAVQAIQAERRRVTAGRLLSPQRLLKGQRPLESALLSEKCDIVWRLLLCIMLT